eukprot:46086_1
MNSNSILFLLVLVAYTSADLYIQSARGSNNRLDERGRERANGNRLFDSQNNNRGGYNVGHMTYYTGERIPISWTNQHSSGKYQLKESEIILQYACDGLMRDGTTTNRIPDEPVNCRNYNCDTDVEYGRHESWSSYQYCKATSRNKGLFTANQNLRNRDSAKYTRQDSAGTRYGYECPEERDYYPYWRHSMWRDIAIYTNTVERCAAYREESLNRKSRWECRYTDEYWNHVLYGFVASANGELRLNQSACEDNEDGYYVHPRSNQTLYKYEWIEMASWAIDAPQCQQTRTTRVNHHGIPGDRTWWTHYWTVPDEILDIDGHDQCCVIRVRYNITTNEYDAWQTDDGIAAGVDATNNTQHTSSPDPDDDPAALKLWQDFGLAYEDIEASFTASNADSEEQKQSRGYEAMGESTETSSRMLQLAIATDQFGRIFQDRKHCLSVKDRAEAGIVQFKRGVYPATEYVLVPEPAVVYQDSYVHFCWTGSNRNPQNNDGQGLEGTDRSNLCPLTQPQWDKTQSYGDIDGSVQQRETDGAVGDIGNAYPDWIQEPAYALPVYYNYAPKRDIPRHSAEYKSSTAAQKDFDLNDYPYNDAYNEHWFGRQRGGVSQMAGLDEEVLAALCTTRRVDALYSADYGLFDYGNMEELDDAGTTFCIEPVQVRATGIWHFICTRNNNFSNRSQKGSLVVSNAFTEWISATSVGHFGVATQGQAKIVILPLSVQEGDSMDFVVTTWLNRGEDSTIVQLSGADGGEFPADALVADRWIELWIPYTGKSLSYPKAWYREATEDEWTAHSDASIEYEADTSFSVIQVTDGGYYTVTNEPDMLACVALVGGILLFAIAMFLVIKRNCIRKEATSI